MYCAVSPRHNSCAIGPTMQRHVAQSRKRLWLGVRSLPSSQPVAPCSIRFAIALAPTATAHLPPPSSMPRPTPTTTEDMPAASNDPRQIGFNACRVTLNSFHGWARRVAYLRRQPADRNIAHPMCPRIMGTLGVTRRLGYEVSRHPQPSRRMPVRRTERSRSSRQPRLPHRSMRHRMPACRPHSFWLRIGRSAPR
jgi:hypothetical protein